MLTSQTIKSIQDIMRKDVGVDGDAQRIGQLGWMLFLKILDDQEQEFELLDDKYRSPISEKLRWRNWAADAEGITGDALLDFVNNQLFGSLKNLSNGNPRALVVRSAFEDAYNYMKSGTLLRQVVNKLNADFDFNRSEDRHVFNDIYEQILKDLQSAGNAGEYYTPRAVTQFAVEMIDPKLGETVLDPACGTGGFLTCAIEHVRKRYVKSVDDDEKLQRSIRGVDKKQLPHLLAVTNMLLHGIAVPSNIRHDNTLARPLREYGARDRVDVIVTNPPFGGMEEDGIEQNFPQALRTRETADLFLLLIMHLLKDGGRAAIVLPDGTLFGEGVKTRIKEKLLTECSLHTVIRLPNGVFNPYTSIKTNVLFFEKGKPTKQIWYYEHPYPAGQKSYNKTNPIRIEEFAAEKKWWKKRVESEHAWKVDFKKLLEETKARAQPHWEAAQKYDKQALDREGDEQERLEGLARSERAAGDAIYATAFNLDLKNPHGAENEAGDPEKLLADLQKLEAEIDVVRERLRHEFMVSLER
jgi:type I restriction enzyme M protein